MVNIELFKCPVSAPYIITQTYQEHLDYAVTHPEIAYNGGIDLYSEDHSVFAAFDGVCCKVAFQQNGYGNYIMLRHAWGFSLYAHLSQIGINIDNRVTSGTKIGVMGSTGFSTGIHLHFEMRNVGGIVMDPSEFFVNSGLFPDDGDNAHSPLTAVTAPAGGNLRKKPMGELITTIPNGTVGKIISGPVYMYGLACYQVEFPVTGWMAAADSFGTQILESLPGSSAEEQIIGNDQDGGSNPSPASNKE